MNLSALDHAPAIITQAISRANALDSGNTNIRVIVIKTAIITTIILITVAYFTYLACKKWIIHRAEQQVNNVIVSNMYTIIDKLQMGLAIGNPILVNTTLDGAIPIIGMMLQKAIVSPQVPEERRQVLRKALELLPSVPSLLNIHMPQLMTNPEIKSRVLNLLGAFQTDLALIQRNGGEIRSIISAINPFIKELTPVLTALVAVKDASIKAFYALPDVAAQIDFNEVLEEDMPYTAQVLPNVMQIFNQAKEELMASQLPAIVRQHFAPVLPQGDELDATPGDTPS